jgi:hypothetical protein
MKRVFILALLLAPVVAFPQGSDPTRPGIAVIPMFGDGVVFNLPPGWVKMYQQRNESVAIVEFLPEGQTLELWREMITVQAVRNPPAQVTPKSFMELMAGRIRESCGAPTVAIPLEDLKIDGSPAFSAIMGCGALPRPTAGAQAGQGEVAYYLAVRGGKDMLIFQRAVRGPGFERSKSPISAANAGALRDAFLPIRICSLADPAADCAKPNPR